jgi:hypothetical protein
MMKTSNGVKKIIASVLIVSILSCMDTEDETEAEKKGKRRENRRFLYFGSRKMGRICSPESIRS